LPDWFLYSSLGVLAIVPDGVRHSVAIDARERYRHSVPTVVSAANIWGTLGVF
jgi:hypothetical protein